MKLDLWCLGLGVIPFTVRIGLILVVPVVFGFSRDGAIGESAIGGS